MVAVDFKALAARFDGAGIRAIVLMGSYARGDAGPLSDIDLVRFTDGHAAHDGAGSYLIDGRLVVVSAWDPAQVEQVFQGPESACGYIEGLRYGKALIDREGYFAGLQARARAFVWDAAMQERANVWTSGQLVGWAEEVHKGLAGLRQGGTGRLLEASFGLSWGLSRVMQVQRGVLLISDNSAYDQVAEAVGKDSEWERLRRTAFGIESEEGEAPSLVEQVIAGLRLYVSTAQLLEAVFQPDDAALIVDTVKLIRSELGN